MKQFAFLIISYTPSLENIAQILSHSFWPNQLTFTIFHISTLGNAQYIVHNLEGTINRIVHV